VKSEPRRSWKRSIPGAGYTQGKPDAGAWPLALKPKERDSLEPEVDYPEDRKINLSIDF